MSADLEGRIAIRLTRRGDAVAGVEIRSSRPQLAQKFMAGRTPEAVAHLAGLIFSLCGRAQRVAAQAACAAAEGQFPDAAASRNRDTAVLLELAQEHAWRLLLDWPRQQGLAPDQASQLRLRQAAGEPRRFAETLDDLLRTALLGEPAATWLARDLAGFDTWRRAGRTPTARLFSALGEGADTGIGDADLLPPLQRLEDAAARDLARRALEDPAFCGLPLWRGAPAETGALARVFGHPLLAAWIAQRGRGVGARLLARLLELVALPARLSDLRGAGIHAGSLVEPGTAGSALVRAWYLGDNTGLAGVETSRGLLLHVVRLGKGKVAEYRIVAPTEWNFHPAGPLPRALASLAADADPEANARLVCQSLDPCVAYGIEVSDA